MTPRAIRSLPVPPTGGTAPSRGYWLQSGLNVVFVSRQLGHANANITLEVYAHLFQRADHADTARAALDASYATNATAGV